MRHPFRFELAACALAAAVLCATTACASDRAPAHAAKAEPAAAPASSSAGAASAASTEAETLDRLRSKLTERLSAAKASPNSGPYDLRVATRPAPPPKPAAHGAASRGGAASSPAAGHAAADVHWAYNGGTGPLAWGTLKPEFGLCASGQRQSPIDIRGGLAVDLDPVRFEYQASRFGVIDNGHTVQVNVAPGNWIEIGGRRFELMQFHFHRPSEERIDGRQFEMSVHLVHKDEQGRLAVVTVLLDKGAPQAVVQKVWNNLPLERNDEVAARVPVDLNDLLPADRRYYTYMGSLTTPPCSEGVQWIVMRQPVTVTPEQIELFARIYPMNARPLQAAAGRRILQSQ